MSNPKESINLSVQDTLRLLVKMLQEGHIQTPLKMAHVFMTEAADRIDELEAELARYKPDREMYD